MSFAESQIYYIDSSKRLSGTTSDFTYKLNIPKEYNRAVVLQANIPMSYYLVRNGLNQFSVNENGNIIDITIPRGNYSAISFKNVLKNLLNSNCSWTYEIELPNSINEANTAKFTYSVTNNSHQPTFIFGETLIHEQMGFNKNSSYTFDANNLISENLIKFIPEDTLFIHSSICADNNNDILQEIYNNNSVQFSNIVYHCNNFEMYSKPVKDNKANVYNFRLCDEEGNIINLNGLNMIITLLLYKTDNIKDIVKNYIFYELNKK